MPSKKKPTTSAGKAQTTSFAYGPAPSPDIEEWLMDVAELVERKGKEYGNSFTESAGVFKAPSDSPRSAVCRLYLQRVFDKLKRIEASTGVDIVEALESEEDFTESVIEDALKDIVGYSILLKKYLVANETLF